MQRGHNLRVRRAIDQGANRGEKLVTTHACPVNAYGCRPLLELQFMLFNGVAFRGRVQAMQGLPGQRERDRLPPGVYRNSVVAAAGWPMPHLHIQRLDVQRT